MPLLGIISAGHADDDGAIHNCCVGDCAAPPVGDPSDEEPEPRSGIDSLRNNCCVGAAVAGLHGNNDGALEF
jgi:hypothetical protein